jgi:hypothetical protein
MARPAAELAVTAPLRRRRLVPTTARAAGLYGVLGSLYVLFRVGSFTNIGDRVTDTPTYEHVARLALWDPGFWTGERGFTIPLFFKLFTSTEARIVAQLAFSIGSWLVLAAAAASCVRDRRLRPVLFASVLAFSLTTEVILWDTLLLSESLTFSLMALLVAAWLRLAVAPRWKLVISVLAVSVLWAFARDTNGQLLAVVALILLGSVFRPKHRRLKLALAFGCVAIFALDYASADVGKRWLQPMQNVISTRVLPNPDLRRFFLERGLDPGSNWPVSAWMRTRSRDVYARYLVTHPLYTLTQPFHGRQQALYSTHDNVRSLIDPNLGIYDDNASHRFLPLPHALERIFFVRGIGFVCGLLAALLIAAAIAWRFAGPTSAWFVPLGIVATTYPHFLLAWHESGYEVDRHALEAALLLRLAMLLLGCFALDRVLFFLRARPDDTSGYTAPMRADPRPGR